MCFSNTITNFWLLRPSVYFMFFSLDIETNFYATSVSIQKNLRYIQSMCWVIKKIFKRVYISSLCKVVAIRPHGL